MVPVGYIMSGILCYNYLMEMKRNIFASEILFTNNAFVKLVTMLSVNISTNANNLLSPLCIFAFVNIVTSWIVKHFTIRTVVPLT